MNKSEQGLNAYLSGHVAEKVAADFLCKKGYHLVALNVLGKRGSGANELDLVMTDKKTLVFVEVKKRASLEDALSSVDTRVQKRLYRAAEAFLSQNPNYANVDCRFDVVCIVPNAAPVHLQNVIEAS